MMTRTLRMAYWPVTVVVAALFAVPGAALIAQVPHFVAEMARLGYPTYFLTLFGAFKVAGALVILAPRLPTLKEWAYAGLSFDIVGAIVSRISVGDPPITVALPALIGALLALSWGLRPAARRLVASNPAAA
jgi:DoxX-like family